MKTLWRAALLLLIPSTIFAQATTGMILGTVTTEGKPLPGVTVSVASPSLQGTRTAVTGEAGGYNFPSLPPGEYTATFEVLPEVGKVDVSQLAITRPTAQVGDADVDTMIETLRGQRRQWSPVKRAALRPQAT